MIRLIKIEFRKIFSNRAFWILMGLYVLMIFPSAFILDQIFENITGQNEVDPYGSPLEPSIPTIFGFPQVWHHMAYLFSWFQLFLAIVLIIFVCNEYYYKTLRQNIMDGLTRKEVILGKQFVILFLSIVSTIILVLMAFLLGDKQADQNYFDGFIAVFAYFVTLLIYLNFSYLIATLVKRSGLAIGLLILYNIFEKILSFIIIKAAGIDASLFVSPKQTSWLPYNLMDSILPSPFAALEAKMEIGPNLGAYNICLAGFYILFFVGMIYLLLKRTVAKR